MSQLGGYAGRFLFVDLSSAGLTNESPQASFLRTYVGGYGVGARILYDRLPAGAAPLGPDNILGLITGPLTGTPVLMSGRFCAVGKSPLTGGWGDANCGGKFGPTLKFAGYDAVFVSGISPGPVYLLVEDGRAELRPAEDLWGLDCLETEQALQDRHGKNAQVACIGPAGERSTLFSCIITDRGRAAGRSGLGAVMGSKRLKAVVVLGNREPAVASPASVQELRKKYMPAVQGEIGQLLQELGTAGITAMMVEVGRTPIKNWGGTFPDDFPNAAALDGPALVPVEVRKYGCWGCPVRCGAIVRWESGGQEHEGHKPEYETLATCGTFCGVDDLQAIMDMNQICNRAGLDTISAGSVIAFAMECYEKGVVTKEDLDGLELRWGAGEAAIELLKLIVTRRGVGDVLAQGVSRAAQVLGKGCEGFAIHAGGQELPAHDPRQLNELAVQYQISPTPGRHTQGGGWIGEIPAEGFAEFGVDPELEVKDPRSFKAKAYRAHMAWSNVLQASGACSMGGDVLGPQFLHEFIAAVTGWDYDMDECIQTGERIEVVRHLFGLREGINPLQNELAPRALGKPPLSKGPISGVTVEPGELRRAYLAVMDWDPVSAVPSADRLAALGLQELALS